jgi:SAM-dependent methyltransferase
MFSETAELYDKVYSFKDYPAEAARVRELVTAASGPADGPLLDVACGTGLHLQALAAWYDVAGLDLDDELLAVARHRLPDVPLHHGDMRDFDLGRRFGVVTCLFSSIGYATTVEEMRRAVAAMARHLASGGLLLVEPWFEPDSIRRDYVGLNRYEEPGLTIARMSHTRVEGRVSTLEFEYLVGRSGTGITHHAERHELGLFTREEMTAAFEDAGLRVTYDQEGLSGRGMYVGIRAA